MLTPWKESYDQSRQNIKKHTLFCQQSLIIKAMVFPVVMYGCESWTINKAEHQRIDAFELWCWRRLLRFHWTAKRSNQFILKEISPDYSLEGLLLKLKLQYFGHLMQRTDSFQKTLILNKFEESSRKKRGWQRMKWLDGSPTQWTTPEFGDGQGGLACAIHGDAKSWTRQSDWPEQNWTDVCIIYIYVCIVIYIHTYVCIITIRLPRWLNGKESAWKCRRRRRCGFNVWVRNILWRRKWQPTLVFMPRKSQGQRNLSGYHQHGWKEANTTEWLKMHT